MKSPSSKPPFAAHATTGYARWADRSARVALASALLAPLGATLSTPAHAYLGPGAGLGVIGTLFGIVAAIVLAMFGLLWYPLKRAFGRKATVGGPPSAAPTAAPVPSPDPASLQGSKASDVSPVTPADPTAPTAPIDPAARRNPSAPPE